MDNPLIVKRLIEYGADVNYNNNVPLFSALYKGNLETVKILVENGANINSRILNAAVYINNLAIVNYLIQQGGDYNLVNPEYMRKRTQVTEYIRFMQNNRDPVDLLDRINRQDAESELDNQMIMMEEEEKALADVNKDIRRKIIYTKYKDSLCRKLDRKSLYVLHAFAHFLGIELIGNDMHNRQEICNRITDVI